MLPRLLAALAALALVAFGCAPSSAPDGDGSGGSGDGAGDSTITGSIVDAGDTRLPVVDAYIYVPRSPVRSARQADLVATHSDDDGAYELQGVPSGSQTIVIEPPEGTGYAGMQIDLDVPAASTIHLRLTLAKQDLANRVSAVAVTPDPIQLNRKQTQQFTAAVYDTEGGEMALTPTWLAKSGVGAVDENGLFTSADMPAEGNVLAVVAGKIGTSRVTVVNRTPGISALAANPQYIVFWEGTCVLTATVTDADADVLTYEWTATAGTIVADAAPSSSATWAPPQATGDFTITCKASDPFGGSDTAEVVLSVSRARWEFLTGAEVYSSPAIGPDGTVYVGSNDWSLYAVNPDGTMRWRFPTGEYVWSSPAVGADGTIYVGSADRNLYAVSPDGTEKWEFLTIAGVYSRPAIGGDGTVYVGDAVNKLYALNPDGTKRWEFTTGDGVPSSPAIGPDGTIYVGANDSKLYAVSPDGTAEWEFPTGTSVDSTPGFGPDGTIYVGSEDCKLHAVNPDGTKKWEFPTGGWVFSSPRVSTDGTIYVGSMDGKLYAVNPDGTERWEFPTFNSVLSSPALGIDGTIYVGSDDTKLYAVNPDGTKRWEFITATGVYSSPAIGPDGTVYVGSGDGKLYALGP